LRFGTYEQEKIYSDTSAPDLLERRKGWNTPAPEGYALPTEIWRETVERRNRYGEVRQKIENGEITEINGFITYNLDIRQFTADLIANTEDPKLIREFYVLEKVTKLNSKLMNSLKKNSIRRKALSKKTGSVEYDEFWPRYSKITDYNGFRGGYNLLKLLSRIPAVLSVPGFPVRKPGINASAFFSVFSVSLCEIPLRNCSLP